MDVGLCRIVVFWRIQENSKVVAVLDKGFQRVQIRFDDMLLFGGREFMVGVSSCCQVGICDDGVNPMKIQGLPLAFETGLISMSYKRRGKGWLMLTFHRIPAP